MTEKETLIQFAILWDAAIVGNNSKEIASFMSEDWKIIGSEGITLRDRFLQLIEDGILMHSKMDSDYITAEVYDTTGIVIARGTSEGTYMGNKFSLYEWSTSVFIKREGKWLCVSTMLAHAKK
ncbi:MAG TPA: nuclear transport factor 2 family protein [Saprospiraceae bacterium]|nr:nuclear transport factor 2 family protein [Saprospiraceae bacterium]